VEKFKGALVVGALRLFALLPWRAVQGVGAGIGWLMWKLPNRSREVVRINLSKCFPELSETELEKLQSPHISIVRGKGLLNAIVIQHSNKEAAWELCLELKENGLLAKTTHGDKIRFAPPLIIAREQIMECVGIIGRSLVLLD
jgi:lauroyl/myristoyl acyltransferase